MFAEFGEQEVKQCTAHFKVALERAGVDVDDVVTEWCLLRGQLYRKRDFRKLSWAQVNGLYDITCANILSLIDLLLTIPVATAECERGFSRMKIIKNDYRTCLRSTVLTNIMRIQLDSPSLSAFDPLEAIHLWHKDSEKHRRPDFVQDDTESDLCSDGELSE